MTSLRTKVHSLVRLTGYDLHKVAHARPSYGLDNFFPLLRQLGFAPRHIIDVGANHGNWTKAALAYFPQATYTLIEPQNHLRVHIQELEASHKINWINAGCSDEIGELPLVVSYRDDSSTFMQADRSGRAIEGTQIVVPITTLDNIVAKCDAPLPELVKIDAEGFDLKVLRGAKSLLGKTEIFLVEALICANSYDNTLGAVTRFMSDAGYSVMDVTDLNRSPKHGVLWLVELAFLRDGSDLLKSAQSYE
jgi:FkbM family methyltransferase